VEEFKYLGTTLTNKSSIQEEIRSRLKPGNACYYSVQNLLYTSLLSKNLKIKISSSSSSSSSMDWVVWPVPASTHCHRFLGRTWSLLLWGLLLRACFGSLVMSILSRWLIQFCLYLNLISC